MFPDLTALARSLPALFCALFVTILFLQSGFDKVVDWKGNLGWLNGHFSKTPLASFVPLMLGVITILELATGVIAGIGIVYFVVTGSMSLVFIASVIGAATITSLFFGQRIAKDYPGAAVLVPYFLLMIVLMLLSGASYVAP